MKIDNNARFSLFDWLEQAAVQPKPTGVQVSTQLPHDLPEADQAAIDRVRAILLVHETKRDRAWEKLVAWWNIEK